MIRGDSGGHKIGLCVARLQCLKSSSGTRTLKKMIQTECLQLNRKYFLIKSSFLCHFIIFYQFFVSMTTSFFLLQILMLATSSMGKVSLDLRRLDLRYHSRKLLRRQSGGKSIPFQSEQRRVADVYTQRRLRFIWLFDTY
jgi:hypothetical protein